MLSLGYNHAVFMLFSRYYYAITYNSNNYQTTTDRGESFV